MLIVGARGVGGGGCRGANSPDLFRAERDDIAPEDPHPMPPRLIRAHLRAPGVAALRATPPIRQRTDIIHGISSANLVNCRSRPAPACTPNVNQHRLKGGWSGLKSSPALFGIYTGIRARMRFKTPIASVSPPDSRIHIATCKPGSRIFAIDTPKVLLPWRFGYRSYRTCSFKIFIVFFLMGSVHNWIWINEK